MTAEIISFKSKEVLNKEQLEKAQKEKESDKGIKTYVSSFADSLRQLERDSPGCYDIEKCILVIPFKNSFETVHITSRSVALEDVTEYLSNALTKSIRGPDEYA